MNATKADNPTNHAKCSFSVSIFDSYDSFSFAFHFINFFINLFLQTSFSLSYNSLIHLYLESDNYNSNNSSTFLLVSGMI